MSGFEFDKLYINTSGGDHEYGPVASDAFTDYFQFDHAYAYAYISLVINSENYVLQPIDYLGELK